MFVRSLNRPSLDTVIYTGSDGNTRGAADPFGGPRWTQAFTAQASLDSGDIVGAAQLTGPGSPFVLFPLTEVRNGYFKSLGQLQNPKVIIANPSATPCPPADGELIIEDRTPKEPAKVKVINETTDKATLKLETQLPGGPARSVVVEPGSTAEIEFPSKVEGLRILDFNPPQALVPDLGGRWDLEPGTETTFIWRTVSDSKQGEGRELLILPSLRISDQ